MSVEMDRPYACGTPGCSQRFPSEDHLMIHRHKHEMSLKFPSIKSDNVLSDQTPTPTRFLRSCEEVGLFGELHFCTQTEDDSKQESLSQNHDRMTNHSSSPANHSSSPAQQQAPPSPQASPVITQAHSTNQQLGPIPGSLSCLLHLRARQRQPLPASDPTLPDPALPDSSLPGSSAVHLAQVERQRMASMGSSMIGSSYSSSGSSPQFPSLHSEAKQRLKVALGHHPGSITNGNINGMDPPTLAGVSVWGGPAQAWGDDPDERRQKFLERNRAAATRCRQKRKVWVSSLEKKAEELSHTNLQLQNEVTQLKTEVTQLKQLLLTHRDCPVTARQKHRGYLSPESSPAGSPAPSCSQVIQHNSISTSTAAGGDAVHGQLHTHALNPLL
ncbi:hypothetical protein AAFF_G00265080 [Aldrovandia affinis]|uniref:Cyclic AMP-dependent transcription factor ATF-7 n=1 Tax=Aldrovandia affinis TaxID=143900 RepID=A0AAD7W2Q3_9TELE|nr:hypothetical protein AAFF_G00265080 [Aldrovandia affinis]